MLAVTCSKILLSFKTLPPTTSKSVDVAGFIFVVAKFDSCKIDDKLWLDNLCTSQRGCSTSQKSCLPTVVFANVTLANMDILSEADGQKYLKFGKGKSKIVRNKRGFAFGATRLRSETLPLWWIVVRISPWQWREGGAGSDVNLLHGLLWKYGNNL